MSKDPYNCAEPGRIDQLREGRDGFMWRLNQKLYLGRDMPQWKKDDIRAWERQARGKEEPMGYYTYVNGNFKIEPPIRGKELHDFNEEEDIPYGLVTEVYEERKDVEDGVLITRVMESVWTLDDSFKAYSFDDDLQKLVDRFPGHKWIGCVEGSGEENGDMWRLYIREGKVIKHTVKNMWPDPPEND
jgi:hypothetical protein